MFKKQISASPCQTLCDGDDDCKAYPLWFIITISALPYTVYFQTKVLVTMWVPMFGSSQSNKSGQYTALGVFSPFYSIFLCNYLSSNDFPGGNLTKR